MKLLTILVSLLAFCSWGSMSLASDGADRLKEIQEYNLDKGLGLKGYDPVSYFPEGGGAALKGNPEISMDFGGVTYYFANQENLDLFMDEAIKNKQTGQKVLKYEPTYGGWCAYAMGVAGQKVDIDPVLFDLDGDRLHFFINSDARQSWLDDKSSLESSADRRWRRILVKARRR